MSGMYDKVNVLKKIGWYDNAEVAVHEKLTDLFNNMVDYFHAQAIHVGEIPNDIYVGGYYPINPQRSFPCVIKKAHKYIDSNKLAIHQSYNAYCDFLRSPKAHQIASDMTHFMSGNLEFYLIDEFITQTYGQIF